MTRMTLPLYWEDNNGKKLIGSAVVNDETFEIISTVSDPDYIDRIGGDSFMGSLGDMMPPGVHLAKDAKIVVHDER